ncbi:MAG: TrbG/VirB9 family P-type conjugative transfer protein, partial [Pseudomonadota bacterium]|nr:TrbG/VirB9 family P-type conjugative transfer protein [Pseudomonadota bacterium]
MKKLLAITSLLLSALPGIVLADGTDPVPPSDYRIKLVQYSDEDVYTIITKYGYQTNIVFGEGEEIQTISVGDRSLWQIIPSGNRLFIRPMEDGVTTNMTVITNRHSYQFDLKSVAADGGGNIYVAKFIYPDTRQPAYAPPPMASAPPPPRIYAPPPNASPPHAFNTNYTYTGKDALAPLQVYDNGRDTFMQYRKNQPLPGVYAVDKSGNKRAVSYIVRNDTMVINKVAPEWL